MKHSQNQFHRLGKMVCDHNEIILEMVQYLGAEQ